LRSQSWFEIVRQADRIQFRRLIMKRNTELMIATVLFLAVAVVGSAQAQLPHCSNASEAGAWAFTTTGLIVGIGPVAAVGSFTQDAAGNVTGAQTRSLAGAIAQETIAGTVTVNSDCTATATINVFQSGTLVRTSTLDAVYDNNGKESRAIFTSLVLPNGASLGGVLTVDFKKVR
jgi:hypothetical protein